MKLAAESEAKMESIGLQVADHVSAMLAYWDKNLVCRFANAAYRDWFGKTREEMVGKITIKELLGPLFEKNQPFILGALAGEPQTFERDIPVPGGGVRHSLASYFPDIVNGEVRGFFVHVADISQIKLLEKKLLRSNEVIKEQNQRLLSFANIVSHNLKSYANNLKSILDLFMKAEAGEEKEILLNYLEGISRGFSQTVEHLTEIVEVQNLSSRLKSERINLHDYIERAREILNVQIKTVNATILNNVNENIILSVNPAYMQSIILNLLTNAIKYRHRERNPVIEVDACVVNDELELKIKDNGLGINLEKHGKHIFGMYKTFHGNPDAKGIGLFITKLQVEALEGRIEVESEEGVGTIFTIHVPFDKKQ